MLNYVIYLVMPEGYMYLASKLNKMKEQIQNDDIKLHIQKLSKNYEEELINFCYNNNCCNEDLLLISDNNEVLQIIKQQGVAAVGFYHENNKDENFENILYVVTDVEDLSGCSYDEVYRRLKNIPLDILETKRLYVRESTVEDVEEFYRIYEDPSITQYMEDLFQDKDKERAYMQDYIKQMYGFYGFGMWTVIEKNSCKIIGRAGLNVREGYDLPELGFVIDKRYQRQGYANEVCEAILYYAKNELAFDEVQALVIKENIASAELLDKLGFVYERDVTENGQSYQLKIKKL